LKNLTHVFQQKFFYIGLVVALLAGVIMSLATMGSTVSPTPKHLPVALVVADQGAQIPGKGEMNFGKTIAEKITAAPAAADTEPPLDWTIVSSEQQALDGLDHEKFYAALVLPQDLSQKLVSLQSPKPQPGEVKVYLNQGMNASGATMVGTIVDKMLQGVNAQFRDQTLGALQARGGTLTIEQAKAIATPIVTNSTIVHPVGTHSANGNAPATLTQVMWMCGIAGMVLMFLAGNKNAENKSKFGIRVGQLISGIVVAAVAAGTILLMDSWLGLEVADKGQLFLFLAFGVYCFYLLQLAVVSWIGLGGMPLLILLFFFAGPLLTLPKEVLPSFSQDWLFSWSPFRFSAEMLRDVLYFGDGVNLATPAWTLGIIGIVAAVLILASAVKKPQAKKVSETQAA
jgi:YhgE/Pip-like protein